jgi:uncharacterized protein YbaA (DUF1428 family)
VPDAGVDYWQRMVALLVDGLRYGARGRRRRPLAAWTTDEFGCRTRSHAQRPDNRAKEPQMAGYVDGFVMPLPKSNVDKYREVASTAGGLWMEHGALDYKECLADDVSVGEVTSFPRSVKLKDDETVIFAWISYESRQHRDDVNAKVMADERMKALMDPAGEIADYKRMIYGGFEVIVNL